MTSLRTLFRVRSRLHIGSRDGLAAAARQVRGPSMVPAVRDGDRLLVWLRPPRRRRRIGRLVLVALPDRPLSVKRLVRSSRTAGSGSRATTRSGAPTAGRSARCPADALRGVVLVRRLAAPGPAARSPEWRRTGGLLR